MTTDTDLSTLILNLLTQEQYNNAIKNANELYLISNIDNSEIFIATYGATTFEEITTALAANKICICVNNTNSNSIKYGQLILKEDSAYYFESSENTITTISKNLMKISSDDIWTIENINTDDIYLTKINPNGTGSLSLNRKSDSVIGTNSIALGIDSIASGNYSIAEGKETNATGLASHTEGINTTALGSASHAEGDRTIALANYSHAEGYTFVWPLEINGVAGATTYSFTDPSQARFVKDYIGCAVKYLTVYATIISTYYDDSDPNNEIGTVTLNKTLSLNEDLNNVKADFFVGGAFGISSHAEGDNAAAIGEASHAEGNDTIASGLYSHAEGYYTVASGDSSHAEGGNTSATGSKAHAEGYDTSASGLYSHAEGQWTKAIGDVSHTEGYNTEGKGKYSHTEGYYSKVLLEDSEPYVPTSPTDAGCASHAEGLGNIVVGASSHVEGFWNSIYAGTTGAHAEGINNDIAAGGDGIHMEGYYNVAIGSNMDGTHTEGCYTENLGQEGSHVEGKFSKITLDQSEISTPYTWLWEEPGKAAHAEGYQTIASGGGAHSEGNGTTASGCAAHAEGEGTIASGLAAHAEGGDGGLNSVRRNTQASGADSHAEGEGTIASEAASHAEGFWTTASGYVSHAEGSQTIAYSNYSHAEGCQNVVGDNYGHAEGYRTAATGYASHAEGYGTSADIYLTGSAGATTYTYNIDADYEQYLKVGKALMHNNSTVAATITSLSIETKTIDVDQTLSSETALNNTRVTLLALGASGNYGSHAEGNSTLASGSYGSHAEGEVTWASGTSSHAEGGNTTASGNYSHAEGQGTIASGAYSHAAGYTTTALNNQYVIGHYNENSTAGSNTGTTGNAFIIGNGTSSLGSNAFRVTYAGKAYVATSGVSTGADYAEFFEWQDFNPNNEDRRGYFVTLDGEKIKIAQPDDYILGVVSAMPCIIGNGDEDWRGRYIQDEFGAFITEEFEYEEEVREKVIDEETNEVTFEIKTVTKTGTRYKENPDYDPTLPYVQREDRPEWDTVGMMGVLSVRDDGTCKVNSYCQVTEGGIATSSESGYRVIKRINDHAIKIVFK